MCVSVENSNMTMAATGMMTVKDAPASATTTTGGKRRNRRTDTTWFKPLMVSTRQACEMLGLKDPGTVLDLIHHGKLEGVKRGNKYTITVRSIERLAFGDFDK